MKVEKAEKTVNIRRFGACVIACAGALGAASNDAQATTLHLLEPLAPSSLTDIDFDGAGLDGIGGTIFGSEGMIPNPNSLLGAAFDLGGDELFDWIDLQGPADGLPLNAGEILRLVYEEGDGPSCVPEPNTMLLLATGALGVSALRRRKER
jgi:PEP-CTERM motif